MKTLGHILFLDVGIKSLGVAIWTPALTRFTHTECICTSPVPKKGRKVYVYEDNIRRYRELASKFSRIIHKWNIRIAYAEFPSGGSQNMKAATGMAASSAVVTVTCFLNDVMLFGIRPSEVKRVVRDSGKVSKEQVISHARQRYGLSTVPKSSNAEHIADACMCLEAAIRNGSYDR